MDPAPAEPARTRLPSWLAPYLEREALAALALGLASGFPYAMIGATLTTRLTQYGIDKKSVTTFALAFLMYNLKVLWAPLVDRVRLPLLWRFGQRRSWLWLSSAAVAGTVAWLGLAPPDTSLATVAVAAVAVGVCGATLDIVIDAYRIELLQPRQLGVGSGMSQYGWRIGSAGAGALALVLAARTSWAAAYVACSAFLLPALLTSLWMGEPARHREAQTHRGLAGIVADLVAPFVEFFRRHGAWLVLLFVLLHKIGDTLANLTLRLLLADLGFSNDEIATWDVGVGFFAYLAGIFAGGILYNRAGMQRSVLLSLVLMAVSNLSFAWLAVHGHSNLGLALTISFENFASGVGGVIVVAYLSSLCNLAFTATQFALLSAAASVVGRLITGTTAGALIERLGFPAFYLLTTIVAMPGIVLYVLMRRAGLTGEPAADTRPP